MTSNIDPTKPLNSNGFAGDMRNNFAAAKNEIEALQDGLAKKIVWCGTATGTANLVTLTPSPALDSYFDGLILAWIVAVDNTAAVTVNASSLGERALRRGTVGLASGELIAGRAAFAIYEAGPNVLRLIGISGNVAIRRAGGPPMLLVQADGDVTPICVIERFNGVSLPNRSYQLQIDNSGAFVIRDQTAGAQRAKMSPAGHWEPGSPGVGNLGVIPNPWANVEARMLFARRGDANPEVKSQAVGDRLPHLILERISGSSHANREWRMLINGNGSFAIKDQTNGKDALLVNTDGKVEVGEPVVSRRFIADVSGDVVPALELNRSGGVSFTNRDWRAQINSDGEFVVRDHTAGVPRLLINPGGNVRPGDDNTQNLGAAILRWAAVHAVNGTIQTSDEREKTDIKDSALGLDFIERLRPVSYRWADGSHGPLHYGFLGQQMEVALEGAEFGGLSIEDGRYSLNYAEVMAPLVSAVQTLLGMVRELQAEVAELKRS